MRPVLILFFGALLQAEILKLPEPYQSLVELTHATPPEFAADALLRIADSGKIRDREMRRALIEEAFRLSGVANLPVKLRGLPNLVDTRAGLLSQAYAQKLDALSLQSRAVMDMLAVDAPKARQLFLDIVPPRLAPLTCDEALVYDVSDFYTTLAAVAGATPEKDRVNLLLNYMSQISSPAQLAPLATAIKMANVTPQQHEVLWSTFNGILESLQPDPRSFAASLNEINAAVTPRMQASFDKYQKQSAACPSDAGATQSQKETTPKLERYWQSTEAQRLLEDGKKLRAGDSGSDAWRLQLAGYLNALAAWGPSSEKSETDYFHQKSIVYQALVELIPPGSQRDKTLDAFVGFLASSSLYQQSPVEWFMEGNAMLERVRHTNNGEPGKVLEAFERSGNPVLTLRAALEKVLGTKQPSWAPNTN